MLDKLSSKNITSGDRTASVIITELHMKIFYKASVLVILGTGIHTLGTFSGVRGFVNLEYSIFICYAGRHFKSAEDSCIFLRKGNLLYCTQCTDCTMYMLVR